MLAKLLSHVRHNAVAYLALFFALSGTAVAAGQVLRQGSPAGGDLTGAYPNPTIAPNAVGTNEVDGSLTGTDVSDTGGGTLTGADILESSLGKVGEADTLDGQNSTDFLGATAKAADADQLDGKDSTDFLGATAKATDADQLDGNDSAAFQRRVTGTCSVGSAITSIDATGGVTCGSATLFGRIAADGTIIATRGVVSVSHSLDGFYAVTMDRDITNCAAVVTRADINLPRDLNMTVRHVTLSVGPNVLFVNAFDDMGVATSVAYNLVVTC
jgi:hypothetical protein